MSDLSKLSYVGDENNPMYEVMVNDGGADGGSNFTHVIIPSLGSTATTEVMEEAIQAFANVLGAVPGVELRSIKKFTVTETTI